MIVIREPAAAGIFYNVDRNVLIKELNSSFFHKLGPKEIKKQDIIATIVPHDIYSLSSHVAAWSYSKLDKANFIIIGTNHDAVGSKFAVMKQGLWKTPLGEVAIHSRVAQKILDKNKNIEHDVIAHKTEHSIEVQLPFLQYRFGSDFKFVPLVITNNFSDRNFLENCRDIGKSIADVIKTEKEKWIIITTSNLTRGTSEFVKRTDKKLISSIKNLSLQKFFDIVNKNGAFVSGYGAILTTLAAAKELNAKKNKLLKYSTSFEIMNDPLDVAGYASLIIY